MQIDFNEQHQKHESSIRVSRESFSKVIDSSELNILQSPAKHDLPRISTFRGMQIDFNEQRSKQ
jgi:hypothetical protein